MSNDIYYCVILYGATTEKIKKERKLVVFKMSFWRRMEVIVRVAARPVSQRLDAGLVSVSENLNIPRSGVP